MELDAQSDTRAITSTALEGRSLLSMRRYTPEEIELLLDAAAELKELRRQAVYERRLTNKNFALIFLKPSTRTRVSFVVAAAEEGGNLEIFPAEDLRLGDKESVADVARVLGRVFDGIAFRGFDHATIKILADFAGVPVWNGLCDSYHPTQILADLLTLREEFGDLSSAPLTYVGDGRNNQVTSLLIAAVKLGLDLRVLAPPELQPSPDLISELRADDHGRGGTITVSDDPARALDGTAAVYGDVWVSMGEIDAVERRIELLRDFKVTPEMMGLTGRSDTIYLHCLPAFHNLDTEFARSHPGVEEVADEVFEGTSSRVFDQSENRMHTIKALMVLTCNT
ncbi:MAG TPA: ornithine carbamoyltransferase [Solirubrobacterales bacterium]